MSQEFDEKGTLSYIDEIKKNVLSNQSFEVNVPTYCLTHMRLAQLYFHIRDYKKTFYHLSECHGALIRRYAILEDLRKGKSSDDSFDSCTLKAEHLCQSSDYTIDEENGLFRRFSEMPEEWTVVQLTRIPDENEMMISKDSSPQLKEMFISRMQCGPNPDELLVDYNDLPNINVNILDVMRESTSKLSFKGSSARLTVENRKEGSTRIEETIQHLDDNIFMNWKCLFLGKLQDRSLEFRIRNEVNKTLEKHKIELPSGDKTLLYLIAEGVCYYTSKMVKSHIIQKLPGSDEFKKELHLVIMNLSEFMPELKEAKRHPTILIVEDHLDIIPWENMPILKEHPVTRVPSIHFLHALFRAHQSHIHQGLREISEGKINYYVLNPDADLMTSETRMKPFFEARLPQWNGIVGIKPSTKEMSELISLSNTYMYCGHGSGVHLLNGYHVQQMNLKNSVQLLFGCKSGGLKYLGGVVPMMGDILHYSVAGSPCSIGMLYVVLNDDVDAMTAHITNIWLPGTPIDVKTLKPMPDENSKESELLRVILEARKVVNLASNGLALIARGIPVKLVHSDA